MTPEIVAAAQQKQRLAKKRGGIGCLVLIGLVIIGAIVGAGNVGAGKPCPGTCNLRFVRGDGFAKIDYFMHGSSAWDGTMDVARETMAMFDPLKDILVDNPAIATAEVYLQYPTDRLVDEYGESAKTKTGEDFLFLGVAMIPDDAITEVPRYKDEFAFARGQIGAAIRRRMLDVLSLTKWSRNAVDSLR